MVNPWLLASIVRHATPGERHAWGGAQVLFFVDGLEVGTRRHFSPARYVQTEHDVRTQVPEGLLTVTG